MSFCRFQGCHPGNGAEDRLGGILIWRLLCLYTILDCWASGLHRGKEGGGGSNSLEGKNYIFIELFLGAERDFYNISYTRGPLT